MYEKFIEANPTPQSRIDAFTNGILSPDPKGLALLATDPEKAYTKKELYDQFLNFYGLDKLPITKDAVWAYFKGDLSNSLRGSSLEAIGTVVKLRIKKITVNYVTAYQKTDAGRDFGDPIVAIGTYVVNKLSEMNAGYCSLWRILGAAQVPKEIEHRRGFRVYQIIKFLAENQESKFTQAEICDELGIGYVSASYILKHLGKAGVIYYFSSHREVEGRRQKGWAQYRLAGELDDTEEIVKKARKLKPWFSNVGDLRRVVRYIRKKPNDIFERNKLSEKLKIRPKIISHCLSILSELGYLSYELKGREIQSVAKANDITRILWEELFEPIERVAYSLNPNDSELRERLEYYQYHKEEWKKAVKIQLEIYDRERSHIGQEGGNEIRGLILLVLSQHKEGMKASHIYEEVNKRIERKVSESEIYDQLKNLEGIGNVRKLKRGYYVLRS
ncbi:MAG: hypothetical protein ACO2OO_02940 [Candidatus Aenigmatarchaeota archaeon]